MVNLVPGELMTDREWPGLVQPKSHARIPPQRGASPEGSPCAAALLVPELRAGRHPGQLQKPGDKTSFPRPEEELGEPQQGLHNFLSVGAPESCSSPRGQQLLLALLAPGKPAEK